MKFLLLSLTLTVITGVTAQQTMPLYPSGIPNSKPTPNEELSETRDGLLIVRKISVPQLTVFLPPKEKANGTAVVICPGGGYSINALGHEGYDVAREFTKNGVTAFVLKYRIPNEATMVNKEIGPLQDAQQAMKIVRMGAAKWHLNINRIGIMGFSAGGHLASTEGTHYNTPVIDNTGSVSLRPDFMILIYPVISFQDSIGHIGSRNQLLGTAPAKAKVDLYSNELQVTDDTPPVFLVHASDDDVVNVENSVVFYQALLKHKVLGELHIYKNGGHGFGMNNKTTGDKWMQHCINWMDANGWLKMPG